jgi:nitrate reductase gamma subunit
MSINFNNFLPHQYVDDVGFLIAIVVAIGLGVILIRWRTSISIRSSAHLSNSKSSDDPLWRRFVRDVLFQKPISDCSTLKWFAHFAMFWGFVGLALTTTLDEILNPRALPLSIQSPVRLLGNATGLLFVAGVCLSLGFRLSKPGSRRNLAFGDTLFLSLLLIAGLSGFATEILAQVNLFLSDQVSYWIHIGFVATLLISAPFTKFVHAIGRPLIVLAKRKPRSGI